MADRRLEIQWLRALAAVEVALFHSDLVTKGFSPWRIAAQPLYAPWGAIGVEVFFVVSGFIMGMQATRFSAAGFFAARVRRILPLYGLFTSIVILVAFANPAWRLGAFSLTPDLLLRSYLALPGWNYPILSVGWTLEYEMVFYAIVALLIASGAVQAGRVAFALAIAVLGLLGCLLGPASAGSALLHHVASPYMFAFGLGWMLHAAESLPPARRAAALGAFAAIAAMAVLLGPGWGDTLVLRIAGAGALFAAAVAARRVLSADTPLNRAMNRIGDASYSLYLSHWLVLSAAGKALGAISPPAWLDVPARLGVVAVAVAVALAVYRCVELPLDQRLRRLSPARAASPVPVAAAPPVIGPRRAD